MARLILVRHPPVARAWQGRCYGQSDVPLSREGLAMLEPLAVELAAMSPDAIIHSDLVRTRALAERIARHAGLVAHPDSRWRERGFGDWEGRPWNTIYRASGSAMEGMINAPDTFRPGTTGETTRELIERVRLVLNRLPKGKQIVVVTHGGPIAAARHLVEHIPLKQIGSAMIATGSICCLNVQ